MIVIVCFLMVLLVFGSCITGIVLKEPDICFLLASGRWIVEHGQIPQTDPFSYTTHYHWAKYVIEKWLTEVIFYDIWAAVGIAGLLVFDAIVLCLAFIVMPMRIAYLFGWRGFRTILLALIVYWASMVHLTIRPEVFSFLFTGIFFELLIRSARATANSAKIDWRCIAIAGFVSCLWANLHTLFLGAILLTGMYGGSAILERLLPELRSKPLNLTPLLLPVACFIGTLINPYGLGLWEYMPNVFGHFNTNESKPIQLHDALSFGFWPFYLLILWGLKALWQRGVKRPFEQGDLFFRLLIPAGVVGGFNTVRSVPAAGLFLCTGICHVLGLMKVEAKTQALTDDCAPGSANLTQLSTTVNPLAAIDEKIARLVDPLHTMFPLVCILIMAAGTYLTTFIVTPEIPQGSKAFTVPTRAVQFIAAHPPHGNLLNLVHFGNVLMWRIEHNPPVFIDSRYNLFGNDLLLDYWHMLRCEDGWQELLDKYKIGWIFLPPQQELAKRLQQDPAWTLLYSDDDSVVLSRDPRDRKHP